MLSTHNIASVLRLLSQLLLAANWLATIISHVSFCCASGKVTLAVWLT